MRKLTENDVEFVLECHPEHVPYEGNCSAIAPETDAATEDWIQEQLWNGNQWAWCVVVVRAKWKDFEGVDSLGGCSYESEESFKQPGGYFDDMKRAALDNLNENLERTAAQIEELVEEPTCGECGGREDLHYIPEDCSWICDACHEAGIPDDVKYIG